MQEGKRLGLTASLSAAQAMARQAAQAVLSLPASDPHRVGFENYLHASHLTEQTFATDPEVLHAYVDLLTISVMKQHIREGLPPSEPPTAGFNAYMQLLWQTSNVHVFLPPQLGW